jgi:two-component sensor histidine kinase
VNHWRLSTQSQSDQSFVHVAELIHRVRNEYTRAISFAFNIAARSSSRETKSALDEVINHLHAAAEMHRILRPPHEDGLVDFTDRITQLCRAITSSSEISHRGIILLLAVDEPVLLEAFRCWRASLIVSELINNACRHAFSGRPGRISVAIHTAFDRVVCQVSDDGSGAASFEPGLGTHLVDALGTELGGCLERRFTESGTTVTLSFPKDATDLPFQRLDGANGEERNWT